MNWETLKNTLPEFENRLENALTELDMLERCKAFTIDHVCVRLNNANDMDTLKEEATTEGEIISTVNVNGRPISILQLATPFVVGSWNISAVELPHPKPGQSYTDGWEHVEFVIADAENTPEGVEVAFFSAFSHLSKAELQEKHSYKLDTPQAEDDQVPNPTIGIKVNGIGLKFHAIAIQQVVGYKE